MVTRTNNPSAQRTPAPGGAAIIGSERHDSDGPGPEIMSASTLTGDTVVNSAGDELGEVKAIMLDVRGGRIAYAILSFGGFLGMGDKLFAVPWSAFTLDAGEKRFILDVARERLENAPGFDKDHWPAMADPSWATDLHTYYDVRPYWNDATPSSHDPRTSAGSQMRDPKGY